MFTKKSLASKKTLATKKTGYTLIEMVVVGALISTVLGSWLFVSISSKKTDKKLEQKQEYYRLLATLQSTLKRDIRSALNIRVHDNGNYLIDVIRDLSEEGPVVASVIYRKEKEGRVIHRMEDTKKQTYDFSSFPDNDQFAFELIIPLQDRD